MQRPQAATRPRRAFLERLVTGDGISSATQAQALNALSFYFRHVVGEPLGDLGEFQRSRRPRRLPVVLGRDEVRRLLAAVEPPYRLPAALMYGGGLRRLETLRLRVKDFELDRRQISDRDGKGQKDRVTVLPERWRDRLAAHLDDVRKVHVRDLELGYAGATFWPALGPKYPIPPRRNGPGSTYSRRLASASIHPRGKHGATTSMRRFFSARSRKRFAGRALGFPRPVIP